MSKVSAAKAGPKTSAPTPQDYVRHPLAASLALPSAEFQDDALADSIKAHGVRHPVVMLDKKVLDGWSRYRHALKHGAKVEFTEYNGEKDEASILAYLLDVNVHRRHYNALQRAILAARVILEKRNVQPGKRGGGPQEFSLGDAAKMFAVSQPYISLCVRVIESKNTLLIHKVEAGKASREEIEDIISPTPSAQLNATSSVSPSLRSSNTTSSDPEADDDDDDIPASRVGKGAAAAKAAIHRASTVTVLKPTPDVVVRTFKLLKHEDQAKVVATLRPVLETLIKEVIAATAKAAKAKATPSGKAKLKKAA